MKLLAQAFMWEKNILKYENNKFFLLVNYKDFKYYQFPNRLWKNMLENEKNFFLECFLIVVANELNTF